MINLGYIKSDIQKIAEATSSVLGIDVTIVDYNLTRIAGTGIYIDKVGTTLNNYSAFKESLTNKVDLIIEDPKSNELCKMCDSRLNCREFAEVCCPIIYDGKAYGVIGLIAFTEEQANIIKLNKENLMNFLHKMADLISGKIKAQIKTDELNIEKKKLETILNNIDKAVVYIDKKGIIEKYNQKFIETFNLNYEINNKKLLDLLPFIKEHLLYEITTYDKSERFTFKKNNYELKGIYSINPIKLNEELKGFVIDFIDKNDAIKNFNKISGESKITFDKIIGNSSIIQRTKKEALLASKTTSTVLITGESGTGKELFAKSIHNNSNRSDKAFIAVNCAAIPDNLLESELFGYEEGAFTGAKKGGKLGKFELANKGTIFLDEIGDMDIHLQVKLLRVLQEKEIDKLGSKNKVYIDVRIIAATNKDLEDMVKKGLFREDLYYRLNVIPINIPSLRERKEDIPHIVNFLIKKYSQKLNKKVFGIDDDVMEKIINYRWPGNIRELENFVEYSVNMANEEFITYDDIPNKIKNTSNQTNYFENNEIVKLEELEKKEIEKALKKYKDYKKDKEKVAHMLGISRATLYRKLEKYNIKI